VPSKLRREEFALVIARKISLQQTIQHHKKQKSLFLQPFHPSKFMKMRKNFYFMDLEI
jgi:hypothetical protein